MEKSVLLIGSSEVSICNFRKEFVERLLSEGFRVILASPYGSKFEELIKKGCIFCDTPMNRRSKNILRDVPLFRQYIDIIKKYRPGVVITYTIKPNIYGAAAAIMTKTPYFMNITGLGTELHKNGTGRVMLFAALRAIMKKCSCVFFQNIAHQKIFEENRIVSGKTRLVAGSGVNLKAHRLLPFEEHGNRIEILYIGRIMQDKGTGELIEAARKVREKNPDIRISAVGFCEDEYKDTFLRLNADAAVNYLSYTDDVDAVIAKSDAIVNPSYHEGMSNALLEGAACGRPLLASNILGCYEIVDDGETGLLFESKNADDLADKILQFASLPYEERVSMGLRGRKKIEKEFDRELVVDSYMEEIHTLLNIKQPAESFKENKAHA